MLGLSLSGACGNASSPKYTVGLGFYSLLFYSYLLFSLFLPFLFQPGLNGSGYFSEEGGIGGLVTDCLVVTCRGRFLTEGA